MWGARELDADDCIIGNIDRAHSEAAAKALFAACHRKHAGVDKIDAFLDSDLSWKEIQRTY